MSDAKRRGNKAKVLQTGEHIDETQNPQKHGTI